MSVNLHSMIRFYSGLALLSISGILSAQNIAINTSGTAAAATNMLEVTQTSAAANMVAIYAINSGATAGTGYGLYSTKTGAGTTNVAGYFSASGGTSNYGIIVPSGGGNVGIGTSAPASNLVVSGNSSALQAAIAGTMVHIGGADGATPRLLIDGYGGASPVLSGRMSNGTAAAPSATSLNSILLKLSGWGYGTNAYTSSVASISFAAAEAFTNTANGTYIAFNTTPNGTTTTAEKVRIDHSGYVGIGTTTPTNFLHIQGAGVPGIRLSTQVATADKTVSIDLLENEINGVRLFYEGLTGNELEINDFSTSGNLMTIERTGNVGIATVTPASKLHIFNGTSGNTMANTYSQLDIENNADAGIMISNPDANIGRILFGSPGRQYGGLIRWDYTNKNLDLGTDLATANIRFLSGNFAENMRLTGTGNLGIGTTAPQGKLDVYGDIYGVNEYAFSGYTDAINQWDYASLTTNPTGNTVGDDSWYMVGSACWGGGSLSKRRFRRVPGLTLEWEAYCLNNGVAYSMAGFVDGTSTNYSYNQTNANLLYMAAQANVVQVYENGAYVNQIALTYMNTWTKFRVTLTGSGANYYAYGNNQWNLITSTTTNSLKYVRVLIAMYCGTQTYIRNMHVYQQGFDGTTSASGGNSITNACATANYIPKINSASSLTCSQLFDNGTNVGIGTATPVQKLDVVGTINIAAGFNLNQQNATILRLSDNSNTVVNPAVAGGSVYLNWDRGSNTIFGNGASGEIARITSTGYVGIGVVPSGTYKLEISGKIKTTSVNESSDIRWKKDITTLDSALFKVKELRGVNYKWRVDEFKDKEFDKDKQIGLIAQEVEKVFPELVCTDNNGFKSVEYSKLVAVLIEAIKEQQKTIDAQNAQSEIFKTDINYLKASVDFLLKQQAKK